MMVLSKRCFFMLVTILAIPSMGPEISTNSCRPMTSAILVAKFLGVIGALITLRFIIQAIGRGVGVEEDLEVLGEVAADIEEEEFERPETPHEMILSRVQNMVRERPEDAAKLIRTMLMEEGT